VALRTAGPDLGREINSTVYTPEEFADKLSRGHHFVTSVMGKPRSFLIGSEHDLHLGGIAGEAVGGGRADK